MQDASPANFARPGGEKKAPAKMPENQVFGSLRVEERVLVTPSRTIAIPNISTISTGTIVDPRSPIPLIAGVAFLVLAVAAGQTEHAPVGIVLAIVCVLFFAYAMRSTDETHFLIIATNNGSQTLFTGPNRKTLDDVRDLLTRKINERDERATYNINFEKGIIETLNAGHIRADAVVQGDHNQLAVNSPSARVASPGDTLSARNSPAAQVGDGNVAHETRVAITSVNYEAAIPAVADLANHYRQFPEQGELNAKLDEMLALMCAGTPTPPERSRTRLLALDLSSMLQAYPAMVQLFQHIARLAG